MTVLNFPHLIATLLLNEDVDIRYIQKLLGHSSITLRKYILMQLW